MLDVLSKFARHVVIGAMVWPVVAFAQPLPYVALLYQFTGKADGSNPSGGVVQDNAGTFYGETYTGGTTNCSSTQDPYNRGCGTVYSFTPGGGLKVLATFTGPNGAHGNTTLALVGKTLYGVTAHGGANDDGVVFSVGTDGSKFVILHQFDGEDGSDPTTLVAGAGGTLYGTTFTGGTNQYGILYSLTSSGAYKVLYAFTLPLNGTPISLILAPNGTLVGSTKYGGGTSKNNPFGYGTVFSYIPASAAFSTLYALPLSGSEGSTPYVGSIGPGPTVYAADATQVFSLSQKAGFLTVADFDYYSVGSGITSGPLYTPGGILYGVLGGGQSFGGGALYSVQHGSVVDSAFFLTSAGAGPAAKPYFTPGGSLVGTNIDGGLCTNCGSIWQYTP